MFVAVGGIPLLFVKRGDFQAALAGFVGVACLDAGGDVVVGVVVPIVFAVNIAADVGVVGLG